jgi:hypothetical protein
MREAQQTVRERLSGAGITVQWRECLTKNSPRSNMLDPCAEPLVPTELIVRIVQTPRGFALRDELGYSYVDPVQRMGTVATVFADRVYSLAEELNTRAGTLLGNAMAHEIGHLLLGTVEHSGDGLMRQRWAVREGILNQGRAWRFAARDVARMRDGLAARSAGLLKLAQAGVDQQNRKAP